MAVITLTKQEMEIAKNAASRVQEGYFGDYMVGSVTFRVQEDFFNNNAKQLSTIKRGHETAHITKYQKLDSAAMRHLESLKMELATLCHHLKVESLQCGTENLYFTTEESREESRNDSFFKTETPSRQKTQEDRERDAVGSLVLLGGLILVGIIAACASSDKKD